MALFSVVPAISLDNICDETFFKIGILKPLTSSGNLFKHYKKQVCFLSVIDRNVTVWVENVCKFRKFSQISCHTKLEYRYKGGHTERFLFLKKTPAVPLDMYESICYDQLFNNEIQMYTSIAPALEKFSGKSLNLAKFYHSERRTGFAAVVLQDFKTLGFRMSNAKANLSLPHIKLAAQYLGNFHGIAFALKEKHPIMYQDFVDQLKESRFVAETPHPQWHLQIKQARYRLEKATTTYEASVSDEFLEKFCELITDPYLYSKQRVQPVEPMVTLCHGDFLRNNIAYRYDESGEPVDVMMFDMQTFRSSSPMIDLTVLLCLSTFAEVRHKHFEEIFGSYHNALLRAYQQLCDPSVPPYLSRSTLLKEYTLYLPYAIGIAASFLPTLIEPLSIDAETLLKTERTDEEIIANAMTHGGEVCNRELAHQVRELFELSKRHKVDIAAGINVTKCDIPNEIPE